MLSPDHVLINRAIRIIPEYRDTKRSRNRFSFAAVRLIAPIALVETAYLLESYVPVKPTELSSVNLGVFVVAVALSRLCGRAGALIGGFAAVLAIAWVTPPDGSLTVDLAAGPWFLFAAIMIATVALTAPRDPIRWSQLRWRRQNAAQPLYKNLEKAQRSFVIADPMAISLPY